MRRNASIELLRILLMFGIVFLHVTILPECGGVVFPKNLLTSCVPAFVLISGYFGVKFRLSKICRLYATALVVCLVVPLIGGAVLGHCYWRNVFDVWCGYAKSGLGGFWFLHAYAIMMLLAWPVERLLSQTCCCRDRKGLTCICGYVLLLVVVTLGWGYMSRYGCVRGTFPHVHGLEDFSPITLFAIYLIGLTLRLVRLRVRLRWLVLLMILLGGIVCCSGLSLVAYNSPITVLLSVLVFLTSLRVTVPGFLAKIVLWLSPSMFAVYLLHCYLFLPGMEGGYMVLGRRVFIGLQSIGASRLECAFLAACILFVFSVGVDLVRRLASDRVSSVRESICSRVDRLFDRVIDSVVGLVERKYLRTDKDD